MQALNQLTQSTIRPPNMIAFKKSPLLTAISISVWCLGSAAAATTPMLSGYDPVTFLTEHTATLGSAHISQRFQHNTFYFSTIQNNLKHPYTDDLFVFMMNVRRYSTAYSSRESYGEHSEITIIPNLSISKWMQKGILASS